jgi:hypothetical protein
MHCIYLMGKLQRAELLRYTLLVEHVDAGVLGEQADLGRKIYNAEADIRNIMSAYETLINDDKDRELFERLKSARTPCNESYKRVVRVSREGRRPDALNLIRTQLTPLRDATLADTSSAQSITATSRL